ncbi:hypothetical protein [Mycobacterium gordonae]|uniref:Galactosyltransferase C-terminal domain-containing protein n=1 Tax=Mycobacterium gordonae TaxID=1778 RepID=A0A1X1WPQ1_MYCGO|nr:hypothetical protein [Mycobacterium gordonae]MCV7004614.1 glycosyltransferase family 2 protein [Mycobacterium gordonae]ODR16033.1 hypothetical protein BHQ23_31325 [Mycobacterium gordonae]ORV88534.1 hypothetical protein AWC08_22355 [Mycobacterium gordonae]
MTVIIVPFRDKGDPWRKANLNTVLSHLSKIDIAPVVVTPDGRSGSAPFNRSAAYNTGIRQHPSSDVYVFYEADMIINPEQLQQAIDAATQPGLIVPFTIYRYLTREDTTRVHNGATPHDCTPDYVMPQGRSVGAVNVVSAETMTAVGRWDEKFQGWGYDDRAMSHAFEIATESPTRFISGPGVHLWHTPGWKAGGSFRGGADVPPREHAATEANRRRHQLYRRATTAAQVRELTTGKR